MADCCEPGCSDEVLCPVHQALADLRAKVDDRAHRAADIYREEGGTYWEGSMDAYGVVLSLIEEAGR